MRSLRTKRVRFSKEADNWLRVLKSRTGITPNLLCRMGFCLSLEEPSVPRPERYLEDSDREINRGTLLGEFDSVFVALLREWAADRALSEDADLDDFFRAHMNRGVVLLAQRMKQLGDLASVLVPAQR